ncbi:MAG: TIR domain-containing protein, partial [Anaerolineae bacterium]|nr:TIR domain-containing protein [Anaerolineae bacterium]
APEQWVGMDITPAVDQYSLGILTFQMLTGEVPFEGPAPAALLYKHLYDAPPAITTMRTDLNPVVDTVMLKVLAKKPDDRYASVRQYVDTLGAAMAGIRDNGDSTGHIFISYGREDQDYARQLAGHIEKSGFQVWIDDRIDYGDRWFKEIEDAICASGAFVIVMTPDSNESEWVNREILLARREKKPIFPLLLRGREFGMLIDVQYVDVTSGDMPPKAFYERLERELHRP